MQAFCQQKSVSMRQFSHLNALRLTKSCRKLAFDYFDWSVESRSDPKVVK